MTSFLIIDILGPLLSWNSPLIPPTFWVLMAMEEWKVGVGGGNGVGLGMGGGMGLGEGGWSIAGRRRGMLLCWLSLDSEKEYFKVLLIYLGPFPFRVLTFFRHIFSFLKDGAAPGQGPFLDSSYAAQFFRWSVRLLREVPPPLPQGSVSLAV